MLTQLNMFKSISIPNDIYKKLFMAICYHDVVHIPGMQNNEEKSIEKCKKDFGKILNESDFKDISDLILCTKTQANINDIKKIPYGDLIHDLDMISFIDYTTMKNNDVKIRSEYLEFPTHSFYRYKLKYFENLLKTGVFISPQYQQYNNIAK